MRVGRATARGANEELFVVLSIQFSLVVMYYIVLDLLVWSEGGDRLFMWNDFRGVGGCGGSVGWVLVARQLWCGVWHIGRDASLRVVHNPKARPHMHYQKIQELNKTNVNTKTNALSQAARYAEWDRPDRIGAAVSVSPRSEFQWLNN